MTNYTQSLKARFAVYFALAITFSLLISGLISITLVQRYLTQRTISELKDQAAALTQQIESEGLPDNRYLMDLERVNQTRALILPFNEQGLQNLRRRQSPGQALPDSPRLAIIDWDLLDAGGVQVEETRLPGQDSDAIVVAWGFHDGEELAGAVVLARPLRTLTSWGPLAGWFLLSGGISLALSLMMAAVMARRLASPLHEITLAASAVAAGDFSHDVRVRSNDEIGRLAGAFRYMSDEVQKSQEQQRQFIINVSHELKTPLTSISGHVQALRDGVAADPDEAARSLEIVQSETGRLSRLIDDLLSLAKLDSRQFGLRISTLRVRETIAAVAAGYGPQSSERGVIITADAPPELQATADPDRLRQILANLVQNALSQTAAGGTVTITGRSAGEGMAAIDVSDSGRGIAPDELPHVFDRFYRAGHGAREAGLGLGLPISRELARAMGGDIVAVSTPGQGSTFTVTLPFNA